jgi:cyanophycin synthetase
VFEEHPFKVLFDYGHNAHAVAVMADLAQRLDVLGKRIVVLAGPGDRRDEDLVAIANAVAGRFDHYICRRDDNLRNRASDEVPRIQAAALREAGVPEAAISIIPDEQEAITAALNMGQPGDLLLVFADALTRSWKQITKFKPAGAVAWQPPKETAVTSDRDLQRKIAEGIPLVGEGPPTVFNSDGLIRDERGVRLAPDAED